MNYFVLGASGLIGSHLLKILLELPDTDRVIAFSRTPRNSDDKKLTWVSDVSEVEAISFQTTFITMGTTMAKAGSKEAFWSTDVDVPLAIAKKVMSQNLVLVSAKGADEKSFFFYNRAKGALEREIKALNFNGLAILRPSLLLGNRKEHRPGEQLAQQILGKVKSLLPLSIRPVEADTVAHAMADMGVITGLVILENQDLFAYGKQR